MNYCNDTLTASLTSETIDPSKGDCALRLHTYMFGANVGSLNVYEQPSGSEERRLVLTVSGDQGQQWLRYAIPANTTGRFKFIIEATVTYEDYVDIALDDVSLSAGCQQIISDKFCPLTSMTCKDANNTCVAGILVCDAVPDCPNGADEENCPGTE